MFEKSKKYSYAVVKGLFRAIIKKIPVAEEVYEEVSKVFSEEEENLPGALAHPDVLIEDASAVLSPEEIEEFEQIAESSKASKTEMIEKFKEAVEKKTQLITSDRDSALKRAEKFPEPDRTNILYLLDNWVEAKEAKTGVIVTRQRRSVIQIREAKNGVNLNIMSKLPMNQDGIIDLLGGKGERKKTAVGISAQGITKEQIDLLLNHIRKSYCSCLKVKSHLQSAYLYPTLLTDIHAPSHSAFLFGGWRAKNRKPPPVLARKGQDDGGFKWRELINYGLT